MTLIYDIETRTFGKPDATKDEFRVFGYHDLDTNKSGIIIDDIVQVKELLKKHKIVIGFNNTEYDNVILKRYQVNFNYTTIIDLYKIFKSKSGIMKLNLKSFSLDNISKELKIQRKQQDFDYTLLNKDTWSEKEVKIIKDYTLNDIEVTRQMWEYIKNFFEPFKHFIEFDDSRKYKHITSSTGAYVYKVICKEVGIEEDYNDDEEHTTYAGGFVSTPSDEYLTGNIYCLDFASAYPHMYIQANLYSHNCKCCKEDEKYTGGKLFKLSGRYCQKTQGKIENTIKKLYKQRLEYKKNKDNREYALKIILNTIYGISGNETFKNLYNFKTASDCTYMARECIKIAREFYSNAGYKVIYSDTDSVFIKDDFNDIDRILSVKNRIIEEIKQSVPFPQDTFNMGIDAKIKMIYFPKCGKKNYLYLTEDNKIVIKGLPFIKSNASELSQIVFNKYIKQQIIDTQTIKFKEKQIKQWCYNELSSNLDFGAVEFKVFAASTYKNSSQLQCQIANKFGVGVYKLLPNTKNVGVGKGRGYCTKEEFAINNLTIEDIDLTKTFSELSIFTETEINNTELSKWMEET
jgi:DNA polymerase elongation subunit (family B)